MVERWDLKTVKERVCKQENVSVIMTNFFDDKKEMTWNDSMIVKHSAV